MGKSNIIDLTITNNSGYDMQYDKDWFDSGRLANGYSWPQIIKSGETVFIRCYERDWALAGCSGYVQYKASEKTVAIAFSNPSAGSNKLGFGSKGESVWNAMDDHKYHTFLDSAGTFLSALCSATGGSVNTASVEIIPYACCEQITDKKHIINLVIINNSGYDMQYDSDWFDSGRLADGKNWPEVIPRGQVATIQCCEKDYSWAGCSGYVVYTANGRKIAIAFSNPRVGRNKVGVGTDGRQTWDNMDNHGYKPFIEYADRYTALCSCTGDNVNFALVNICINLKVWMKNFDDSVKLHSLSIPGTHESGALNYYGTFSRCQFYGIEEQMNLGIRFLDIRCDISEGKLYIYHGCIYQSASFDEVLDTVIAFLNANPSETIIMSIKNEGKSPDGIFNKIFLDGYWNNAKYHSYFYGENAIPTLGTVRKKIVLVRRFGVETGPGYGIDASTGWDDNRDLVVLNNGVPMAIQDLYNPSDYIAKIQAIQRLMQDQGQYQDRLILNFSSGYEGFPTMNGPENFANKINPLVKKYINENPQQRLGIIVMDFPVIYTLESWINYSTGLIPLIVQTNRI